MSEILREDLAFILTHHRGWEPLRGARLFITGGTGLFGSWLLLALLKANDELALNLRVTVLSRDPSRYLAGQPWLHHRTEVRFVQGDVTQLNWDGEPYDYLLHLATTRADETFRGADQLAKLENLYFGTRAALAFARKAGVRKVLFTSSGVVYGPQPDAHEGLAEYHGGAPNVWRIDSGLGEGKRVAEYLCSYHQATYGLNCVVARCFAFLGPLLPLDLHYAAGNFIRDALADQDIVIRGTGQDLRSYLYLADATVWLLTLLTSQARGVYNVGSSTPVSIEDLAHQTLIHTRSARKVVIQGTSHVVEGNFQRSAYWPNTDKIQAEWGVREWTSWEDGVERTFRHHLQDTGSDPLKNPSF